MGMTRGTGRSPASGVILAAVLAGCAIPIPAPVRSPAAVEHMPGPASVWLTSEPVAPQAAVLVTMTSPSRPDLLFSHLFAPGVPLRGSFATSQGDYRLAAFGGACTLDLALDPSQAADVVLRLDDGGCTLAVQRTGSLDDPAMQHAEPAILVTNHGAADETPFIEPRP